MSVFLRSYVVALYPEFETRSSIFWDW